MPYQYVTSLNRYRDVATGVFISRDEVLSYTQQLIDAGGDASHTLSSLVSDGTLSPDDFIAQMRDELKYTFIQEGILGRGGRSSMTPRDWGGIGAILKPQYQRLEGFRADIQAGKLSEMQIAQRAHQYFDAAREAYERGNAAAHGVYDLPSWPGNDQQTCHGGCLCSWRFENIYDDNGVLIAIYAYWELTLGAEHCEPTDETRGCVQNAAEWNPFVIDMRAA